MPNYIVTGPLGSGKGIACVSRIQEYLNQGRRVATNLNIWPENLGLSSQNKTASIIRLPDKPRACDLKMLGRGHDEDGPDDKRNGIIVLDEVLTWLNAREWRDKGRAELLDWFLHARKHRWDLYFIAQDADFMDSQFQQTLFDHYVQCSRLDRIKPLGVSLPTVFLAHAYYGKSSRGIPVGKWVNRKELFNAFDSEQVFIDDLMYKGDSDEPVDMRAPFSYLTPWHLVGRYEKPVLPSMSLKKIVASVPWYISLIVCRVCSPVRPFFRYSSQK